MSKIDHIIGIDLGTTNSVVAVVENDQPVVLTNSEGSTRTPSVVSFSVDPTEPPLVGELARRQAVLNPERTIFSVKRLMGRSLADVEEWGKDLPYRLVEEDGRLLISVDGYGFTPSQISAFILKKLKETAENYLGEPVERAVITVPAYFDDLQRQATYEAAELAGLRVLRLLNEPTAAAMAYGLGKEHEQRVAVYDFGGGTFDLSILEISGNTFEVVTSVGDTRLGGDDIDALVRDYLLAKLRDTVGADYTPEPLVLQRLREAAEKAKCELSYSRQTTVSLPFIDRLGTQPIHLEVTLRRSELEKMIQPLVDRTLECCERALRDANLSVEDIDRVVLVGGSTRIPLVQEAVEEFFGVAPYKGINPDEVVAMGAAMQGALFTGQMKEVVLLDVTPHSLGVEVEGGRVSRVVEKNSTIPIKAAKLFTTTENDQEVVVIHVLQGEGEKVSECRSLGKFILTNIQKAKAGIPRIQVTFHINADGMVEVSAQDLATQEQAGITLAVSPGEEEPAARRRRKSSRRPATQDTSEIVASPPPGQTTARRRQISVERRGAAGFEPLHVSEEQALSPKPLTKATARATPVAARATATAGDPQSQGDGESEMATVVEPFSLPDPATLPCGPDTRAFLAKLLAAPLWSPPTARDLFEKALKELQLVSVAASHKPGVWPWLAYLTYLADRPSGFEKVLRWARSSAPDNLDAYAMAESLEKREAPHPLLATAKAVVLGKRGQIAEALGVLEPWLDAQEPPKETCEVFIELSRQAGQSLQAPLDNFRLARALIVLQRYDEAIPKLESLAQLPELRIPATRLFGMCCLRKGMTYLAWQKLQGLPMTEDLKELCYEIALEAEKARQHDLAREIYRFLAESTHPFRDVRERLNNLGKVEARPTSAVTTTEMALLTKIFADSRFVILEELNRGSMGVIYRARDKVLDEIVALKVLNDYLASDSNALERFKREARAAKRLSHPNIVRIHDMYEIGPKRLLSMEYISGRDLKTILREQGPLPSAEVVRVAIGVAQALAHAHSLQIIHRDIKSANIMISDDGTIKVTDFGIAKMLVQGPEITHSGSQIVGTPLYMAPEQIKGGDVDGRADIYSLGVTMYELLSGHPPFFEGNIEYHHLHSPPPPLQVPVSFELADIVLRCLAKDPAQRFQSAEELIEALKTVQGLEES